MSFYVTLPSNVSQNLFKDNSITNFSTLLKKPLIFNMPYEVGLVEIIYNQSWRVNLGKLIISDNKILSEFNLYAIDGETYDTLINRINNILSNYFLNKEYERRLTISDELIKKEPLKTESDIIEYIENGKTIIIPVNGFLIKNEKVKNDIKLTLKAPKITIHNQKIHCIFPENFSVKFDGRVLNILYLENNFLDNLTHSKKIIRKNIESINSLFIYTDIIDYQHVGDEFAPLLRNVVVENEYTHSVCRTYESPHYIPVNKSEIYSINIDIRDDTGEKIHFIEGRVIIKLHFRPQRYGF